MSASFENRFLRFIRCHILESVTVLYMVPMFWGSFVPFDFGSPSPVPEGTQTWLKLLVVDVHIPDAAANIALYIPFGLLFRASLLERKWARLTSLFFTLALAAILSWFVEYSQIYSASRVSSKGDWICNMIGAVVGALSVSAALLVISLCRNIKDRVIDDLHENSVRRPSLLLAKILAGTLFLGAVVPFDLTFSPDRIFQSISHTSIIPFNKDAQISRFVLPAPTEGSHQASYISARDHWQLNLDYLWTVASYALLAVFICRYLSKHCHVDGIRKIGWTFSACMMLSLFCFIGQMFIISRTSDVTDILMAGLGAIAGILSAPALIHLWAPASDEHRPYVAASRKTLASMVLGGWCLFLIARECVPFTTNFSPGSIADQIKLAEWLPMWFYQRAKFPVAIDDLLNKFARYVCLGVIICMWRNYKGTIDPQQKIIKTSVVVASAVAALEVVQILLPSRVPALTDVLIALIGTGSGVIVYRVIQAFVSGEIVAQPVATEEVIYNVEFGTEFPAPKEEVPQQPPATAEQSKPSTDQ